MKNVKLILAIVLACLLCAASAGGAAWWFLRPAAKPAPAVPGTASHAESAPAAAAAAAAEHADHKDYKYITLDKVIVMLRRTPGEAVSHYLSADLVIATSEKKEKETKEHLPMLRSVAVQALSAFPMAKAEAMTVDQFAVEINRAFAASYAKDGKERPFANVMIGKLIIE
ncbi:MAG: flagellar basal body protein [Massilia sp.]|jgi:flagellar FliL protein|nr:flagellar basal body protein [Massilia sp.]